MASTDLASVHPPSPIRAGVMLDRYKLVCKLADGGMASVWIARQQGKHGFEKLVAVKTILPSLVDDDPLRKMFLDEARIAARIDHPNVARILDLGEEDRVLYLVMEWVEGESLAKLHRLIAQTKGEFPTGVYLRIVADACAGLHAAHELRDVDGTPLEVVHRDVSPQNILVSTEGHAKLIDFGIARSRGRVSEETSFGIVKGKLHYMPPEQASGSDIDRTADVWALGAMLYHFFAGRPVYAAANEMEVMTKLFSRAAIDPLPEKVPEAIRALTMRALAVRPKDRFATVFDLRTALEEAMTATGLGATTVEAAKFVESMAGSRVAARRDRVRDAIRTLDEGGESVPEVTNPSRTIISTISEPEATSPQQEKPAQKSRVPMILALLAIGVGAGVFLLRPHHQPTAVTDPTPTASSTVSNATAPVLAVSSAPPPETVAIAPSPTPIMTTMRRPAVVAPKVSAAPAHAPEPPPPEPVAVPAPPPPPPSVAAPAAAPPPVVAPAPAATADPQRARVRVAGVQNEHGVRKRDVQAALGRAMGAFIACYRAEIVRTPSGPQGPGTLRIETDESGHVIKTSASVGFSPTVARCIERAASGMVLAEVDTGAALADVLLTFDLE